MHPNCTCRVCGTAFYRSPAQLANGAGVYCSRACQSVVMRQERHEPDTHVERICKRCGKTFTVPRAWLKRDGGNAGTYCSRECRYQPNVGKSLIDKRTGYRWICCPDGQWRLEHRAVAEEMLGRALIKGESVHHRNKRRADNRPENLEVISRSEHQRMHRKEQFPLGAGGWGLNRERCVACGTTEHPHKARGMCEKCHRRERYQKAKAAR